MKILLVTPNFYPEKTGIGVTATDSARLLSQLNHEVEVIAAMPHYPEWSVYPEYRGRFSVREKFEDIVVNRVWIYMPKKLTTKGRILFELSMSVFASIKSLFAKYDVLLAMCPPLTAAAAQAFVAGIRKKPYWTYIQDIQPDAAICLGMLTNKHMITLSKWMERYIYKRADKILVLSDGMKQNIISKGIAQEKIHIVPIAVDLESLKKENRNENESIFRNEYDLGSKFLVLYTGNIGVKQNPEILVECAKKLKDHKDIFFPIVGEGALKDKVEQMIQENKLENIKILPLCNNRDLLSDMLCSCNILLLPQRREVIDIVVPSKLITYLTSGTPVIASVHSDSEAAKVLSENNSGIRVEPEDVDALTQAILRLKSDPTTAAELGARGYELVQAKYEYGVVRDQSYGALFNNQPNSKISESQELAESAVNTL